MKQGGLWQKILRALYRYLVFFLLVAVLVSCTMTVFLSILAKDLNLIFTGENLNHAAKLTFLCVILISVVVTLIDIVRRKLTTEVFTERISAVTKELVQGNFDVRIAPMKTWAMDENLQEIADCVQTMAQELGGVETLRTDFIANVSHEMKTPLAVLQNYGTLLQTPGLSEEKRLEYARGITEGSRRMSDMMTNILKLNRLENQQIYPQNETFDLGEQLCECLLQYESVFDRGEIDVEVELEDNVTVRGDRELLSLVWNNLLSNAFKFTPVGGCVTVTLTATAETATVCVQDTGCGMTPEVGAHIFEKFYQGDRSHATQGNGLGLALVKRVVDILHGEITVKSTVGVGTTFTVKVRRD